MTRALCIASVGVAALMTSTGHASAQAPAAQVVSPVPEADTGALDEIIVTSQRRAQNIQDVPIAVSSFSQDDLTNLKTDSTLELTRLIPNMTGTNNIGQGSANSYYIRGLGQVNSFPTFEPQVGTYVDDIYVSRQNATNFGLFDVSQVQVLRGPQGTLFGRNSTGGAIVVTLAKPADQVSGYVEGGYGSYDKIFGRGSIDLPLSDQFLTKTSVFGNTEHGYAKDLTTGHRFNDSHNWGVREAFRILPATMSNVSWDVSADFARNDNGNFLNQPDAHGDRVGVSGFSSSGGALLPFLTGSKAERGQGAIVKSWGAMSNLEVRFDSATLNVISGYRGVRQYLAADFPLPVLGPPVPYDTGPTGQVALAQDLLSNEFTQELKLNGNVGRLTYTTGVYYLYEKNNNDFGEVLNIAGVIPGFPGSYLPSVAGDQFSRNTTSSAAGYFQGEYRLTDALTLTAGVRYTHEEKTLRVHPNDPGVAPGVTTADLQTFGVRTKLKTDQFTPRFVIQYKLNPDVMVFASATRGFQGGGWNGLAFSADTFNDFGPETLWSYEAGLRAETADHKLRFNSTFFYENVHHYQLLSIQPNSTNFVTANAADLIAYGLETEISWRPFENLTLTGSLGLEDGHWENPNAATLGAEMDCRAGVLAVCNGGIVNSSGHLAKPSNLPPVTAALSAAYKWQLSRYTLTPTAGVQFVAGHSIDTAGSRAGYDKSYATLDLGVAFAIDGQPWSLTAECRNCTMQDWGTSYALNYKYYNHPGVWDVRFRYDF